MIESIQAGIIKALESEFDPAMYEFYTESVEQGLNEPCFSILCLNPSITYGLGSRHQRNYQFMIQYFPLDKDEPRTECICVSELLSIVLADIEVNGMTVHHTGELSGTIEDGVLQFPIVYTMHTDFEHVRDDEMGDIEITRKVK